MPREKEPAGYIVPLWDKRFGSSKSEELKEWRPGDSRQEGRGSPCASRGLPEWRR